MIQPWWQSECGRFTLYCADCLDVLPQLEAGSVQAVVTDPPYGCNFEYQSYDDTPENFERLIDAVIPMMRRIAGFVVMPAGDRLALRRMYEVHNPDWLIAWFKGSPGTRSPIGFNSWEPHPCWGKPPVSMHDCFQTRCGFEIDGHPCPKPVDWALWLVERAALCGGTILDPFTGSGTTGVACVRLGRRFIGIEISEDYCRIAKRRIQQAIEDYALFDRAPEPEPQPMLIGDNA